MKKTTDNGPRTTDAPKAPDRAAGIRAALHEHLMRAGSKNPEHRLELMGAFQAGVRAALGEVGDLVREGMGAIYGGGQRSEVRCRKSEVGGQKIEGDQAGRKRLTSGTTARRFRKGEAV